LAWQLEPFYMIEHYRGPGKVSCQTEPVPPGFTCATWSAASGRHQQHPWRGLCRDSRSCADTQRYTLHMLVRSSLKTER